MNPSSPLAAKLVGICLVAAAASAVLFSIFRHEVMERVADDLSNGPFVEKRTFSDAGLLGAPTFTLRPEQNDIAFVRISNLKTERSTVAGTPISFTLTNLGERNSFPRVRIFLLERSGRPVRQLDFSEKDYVHSGRFDQIEVELLLDLRNGETGFTAQPYYLEKK